MAGALVAPYVAGGISAFAGAVASIQGGASNLLNGGAMGGTGSMTFTGDTMLLSLTVGLNGTGAMSLSGNGFVLAMSIKLDGTGSWSLTGNGNNLAMIVPFEGAGSFSLTGISDLRELLSLSGAWTPFTELSPQSLADAVWEAEAAAHDNAGTMGEKMNGAGSAGNPWTEVIESGLSAADVLRIILSVQAGETTFDGTLFKFKSQDGLIDRVSATMTGSERTAVAVNGA
jgi:hypothetical protein